jgi:hypothetical protein
MHTDQKPNYRTAEQIAQLVESVERCTLTPAEFSHHAHMTVAIWYLARLPLGEAMAVMRTTIQRFAAHHGHHQLYHETITVFWMWLLRHYLDTAGPQLPLADVTYQALVELGSTQAVFRHYSRELLFSDQARREWVAPDLLPMPASSSL